MKIAWSIGIVTLACCLWAPVVAMADPGYVYIGGRAGAGLLESTGLAAADVDFDPGSVYAGALGFRLEGGRLEAEGSYRENTVERLTLKKKGYVYDPGGTFSAWSVMINSIADFANRTGFTPYIFLGAGAARIELEEDLSLGVDFKDTRGVFFAYQGGAGIGCAVTESLSLDVEYRYFSVWQPAFKSSAGEDIDFDFTSHQALLGLRISFW